MIILYKNKNIFAKFTSKEEFNKFIHGFSYFIQETSNTSAEKFLWDIHMNYNALEYRYDGYSDIWDVTDTTGKWYKKDI